MRTGSDAYSRRRRTSAYYVAGGLLLGGVFATAVLLPSTADRQPAALSIEDLYGWVCASLGWGTTTLEEQILVTGERAAGQERGILATGERAAGQERGIIHKKEEFEPPPDMPKGTKCTYMDKWLENAFNSMLEKLVEAIMMAPVLTSLPMELWVQVGPVKAAVRNMTLVGLQLGQIRMGAKTGQCWAPPKEDFGEFIWEHTFGGWHPGQWAGDTVHAAQEWRPGYFMGEMMDFTPQMIPDAFLVEIHLANITDALTVHYDGIFGIGAFDADIVSDQQGAIDLTVTFVRGKPGDGEMTGGTTVTGCGGQFRLGSTHVYGPMGINLGIPAIPFDMPVAALICWGPAALLGPVSSWLPNMANAADAACESIEACSKAKEMGEFLGIAPLLDKLFDKFLPANKYSDWYNDKNVEHAESTPPPAGLSAPAGKAPADLSEGLSLSAQGESLQFATAAHVDKDGVLESEAWQPGKNFKGTEKAPNMTLLCMAAAAKITLDNGGTKDQAKEVMKAMQDHPPAFNLKESREETDGMTAEELAQYYRAKADDYCIGIGGCPMVAELVEEGGGLRLG